MLRTTRNPSLATRVIGALALVLAGGAAQALSLYDPTAGMLPSAQGWLSLCSQPQCSAQVGDGVLALDTLGAGNGAQAGFSRLDQVLDAEAGYRLDFGLRVLDESHASADRAGFVLIAVGSVPSQSLEIGFWKDQVWVYDYDGGAFVKGASAALDTTTWHDYSLSVQAGRFSLRADGHALLDGLLEDYSGFGMPYDLRNFLFLGDDTRSAGAAVQLGAVSLSAVTPVPEPAGAASMLGGLLLVMGAARAGRRSRRPG